MKKGRHRRYEEARKFKQRSADSSIEDIDLDEDDPFASLVTTDGADDGDDDDGYADLAAKYNVDDEDGAA